MSNSTTFGNLRRRLAPLIRPLLEKIPPLRFVAVRLLRLKQSGQLHRCGMDFLLPSGDFGVTLEAESTGEYEPVTTKLLESLLEEGMTFVDVGAHVGLFTLPAAKWVGQSGRVIAFEPHPDNFAMLNDNIEANTLGEHVDAIQSAVSDCTTPVSLHISGFNTGDHFFNYLKDSFDCLYNEGKNFNKPKMMSVGLHCRLIGRPGRMQSLIRFLDYVQNFDDIWICQRKEIADHWHKNYK